MPDVESVKSRAVAEGERTGMRQAGQAKLADGTWLYGAEAWAYREWEERSAAAAMSPGSPVVPGPRDVSPPRRPPAGAGYAPQIGGAPFATPEERERLTAAAIDAPDPILSDPPASVLQRVPPVVLGNLGHTSDWERLVRQAVRDGAVVVDYRDDPRVVRVIAEESALTHEEEAARARETLAKLDAAGGQ